MRRLLGIAVMLMLTLWLTAVAGAEPQLSVVTPTDGETILGTTVAVQVDIKDFKLIKSTVPASEAGKRPEFETLRKGSKAEPDLPSGADQDQPGASGQRQPLPQSEIAKRLGVLESDDRKSGDGAEDDQRARELCNQRRIPPRQ